jgi:pimeloyl-ACP methyl ester carboxylesterase
MERLVDLENGRMYYNDLGSGFPVVLLHGFAEDHIVWNEQVEFLQQHCRLIVPDLPGSGQSDRLMKEEVSMEDYARAVDLLLQVEKIDRCGLFGHSMGGYITLAFAELFPDKLAGFGLVHSTAFADSEEKRNTREKGIKLIEEYGGYNFLKTSLPGLFTDLYKQQHPERVSELVERGKLFRNEALVQYYTAMMNRPDRTDVLQKSTVPVLFIIGSDDTAAPEADLLQQVHLAAVSDIHIVQDVGHMGMWEKASEVNGYLLDFIHTIAVNS